MTQSENDLSAVELVTRTERYVFTNLSTSLSMPSGSIDVIFLPHDYRENSSLVNPSTCPVSAI